MQLIQHRSETSLKIIDRNKKTIQEKKGLGFLMIAIPLLFMCNGCTKEDVKQNTRLQNQVIPPPPPPVNTPIANAGWWDISIVLPENSTLLAGAGSLNMFYTWKKVSGPASHTIDTPNVRTTWVKDLVKGTYEFEFTVTNNTGQSARDTVKVTVFDPPAPGPREVIIKDQVWACPMGCYMIITCFKCYVPAGVPYSIYVKKRNSSTWVKALHDSLYQTHGNVEKYFYSITQHGELSLYTDDEYFADIMIKY